MLGEMYQQLCCIEPTITTIDISDGVMQSLLMESEDLERKPNRFG